MVEWVAAALLRAAANDVAACQALAAVPQMSDTVIGFHAQQACEKCLKAVLSAAGIEFPCSHDLVRLMELAHASDCDFPVHARWIDEINPYARAARYGLVDEGGLDRARTLTTIDALLDWARSRLAAPGST